jgi:hypothetical protein
VELLDVAVRVDAARQDEQAAGIEGRGTAAEAEPDGRDAAVTNRDVGVIGIRGGHDRAAGDDEIVVGHGGGRH